MGVRVIRTLEYHYDSLEAYEKDRVNWTEKSPNKSMGMRTVGVTVSVDDGEWIDYDQAERFLDNEQDIRARQARQVRVMEKLAELGYTKADLP